MKEITEKEKREMMEFMLDNQALEEKMRKWKQQEENPVLFLDFIAELVKRMKNDGGLIISVKSEDVPKGAENIEIFRKDKKGDINIVAGEDGLRLAMVFTSGERFQRCGDTSGFVMFIDELFEFLGTLEKIDGMIINFKEDNIIFDKEIIIVIMNFFKLLSEKNI